MSLERASGYFGPARLSIRGLSNLPTGETIADTHSCAISNQRLPFFIYFAPMLLGLFLYSLALVVFSTLFTLRLQAAAL